MPYTIHTAKAKIRDAYGNFRSVDVFSNEIEDTQQAAIQAVNDAKITAINNIDDRANEKISPDVTNNEVEAMLAPIFNTATAYTAGTYVRNVDGSTNKLYRLTADHAANTTWADTSKVEVKVGSQVTDLKNTLTSYEDAVVLVKNLAGKLTLGKFANSDTSAAGGNIRFYDSETRGYVKIKVKPNTKYAINLNAIDGFSANFSWWAYESDWENGTAISKVIIDSNCITTSPANANLLYLSVNNPSSASVYVVLEQETSIHGATTTEYPYNEVKAVSIPKLIKTEVEELQTAVSDLESDVEILQNDTSETSNVLQSYKDTILIVKNLANKLVLDKYSNSDTQNPGGEINFYDSSTRGYIKIKIKPSTKYAVNMDLSANFSWWAYESADWKNGIAISKVVADENHIITSPANANLLYITVNDPANDSVLVVLEQETSIYGATIDQYPYNEPKAVVIDNLQLDASKYELHNVDVSCMYDSVLSFAWDSINNYMTITTDRTGNNLFVVTSSLGAYILLYSNLNARSWNVPHGSALVFLFNKKQFVTKTEEEVNNLTEPYVVLAYLSSNGSGGNLQISGVWEKYWIKQELNKRIDTTNAIVSGIQEEIGSIISDLPAYYYANNYFPNKLQAVRDGMNFKNGICFAFITDTHFQLNSLQSKKMLSQIIKKTQVPFVVFGGDAPRLIGDMDSLDSDIAVLQSYADAVGRGNWYTVRGNHDFYNRTDAPVESRIYYSKSEGEVYNILMKSFESRMTNGDPEHMCYYIDIPAQKTRIIVLNTTDPQTSPVLGGGAVSEEQAAWLVATINAVEDTNIIVITHIPTDVTLAGEEATNIRYIRWILKAFAAGTDVESKIGGVPYTFTGTTNKLICSISGHNHIDQWSAGSGFLNIVTMCDARYNYDGYPQATNGTITEQAFDVFFVDFDNKTVRTVRFGRGDNRAWNYESKTVIT